MTTGRRADALGACLAWVSHPVNVAALALLLLNDHVFKDAWPGVVTGKLSDLAGMLMFPPVLAAVLAIFLPTLPARFLAAFAVTATGAAFAALKVSPAVAELASQAWSVPNGPSVVLADPTDLIALPALALTWAVWRRCHKRPAMQRQARLVRALVLIPAGLLATVATSSASYRTVTWVGEVDGRIAYGYGYGTVQGDNIGYVSVSEDGGRTFTDVPGEKEFAGRTEVCAESVCYRIVPGELHVQESHDDGATWSTSWQIAGWQYRALAAGHPDLHDAQTSLVSQCIAVFETPDGYVVLVANARDGLLRRDTSGSWERLGVPGEGVVPLRDEPDFTGHRVLAATLGIVAVGVAGMGLLVVLRRRALPRGRIRAFVALVPAAFVFDLCTFVPSRMPLPLWLIWGVVNAAALVACGVIAKSLPLRKTVAFIPVAVATAWFAQAAYQVEPKPDIDLFFLRTGSGLRETAQATSSLLPVAIGMVTAGAIALLVNRIRSLDAAEEVQQLEQT